MTFVAYKLKVLKFGGMHLLDKISFTKFTFCDLKTIEADLLIVHTQYFTNANTTVCDFPSV